jgi:hypothetical protein
LSAVFGCWLFALGCAGEDAANCAVSATNTAAPSAASSASSVASTAPGLLNETKLGDTCTSDTDCETGQFCLLNDPDLFLGTIAGGMCTADCSAANDDCSEFGPEAQCLGSAAKAYCVLGCTTRAASIQCHGRGDMLCLPNNIDFSDGACVPMCQSDADCPGQVCEPSSLGFNASGDLWTLGGVCSAPDPTATAGKPDGAACTADTECTGLWCIPVSDTEGVCGSLCNFTTPSLACHAKGNEPIQSACVGNALESDRSPRPGELSLCYPTCDTDADCHAGLVCVEDAAVLKNLNRAGLCGPPEAETPATPSDADAG